jgi:glycosyltransferase involved in cell wall biosynthesis
MLKGALDDFASIVRIANDKDAPLSLARLTDSSFAWQLCVASYRILMPQASFKDFFWAWQALTGGLFAVVKADLPRARTYHALSTGYAGLLAARARIEGAEHVILTEHGIYTNERQIEILMANWITDTIDKGLAGHQNRLDLRDLWTVAFKSFAAACYAACDRIITLFDGNQAMQRELGAPEHKLSIIPNGIDVDRFDAIPLLPDDAPPTVALIGRIVPIKDVKTFVRAADLVRAELPEARFIVAGPTDETPAYAADCRKLVGQLGLEDAVAFTGRIEIARLLSQCHVVALTSVSEGQPLSILEAGAAGLPCVTTDAGSCREILLGTGEDGNVQPGGFVADAMDAASIAVHMVHLLRDPDLRRRLGSNLKQRVTRHYRAADVAAAYDDLYARAE